MALGPKGKVQILFVCTGNICRSPMGEALLKHKLDPELAHQTNIVSAGTHAYDGMPASSTAKMVAQDFGVNLNDHNSQPLTPYLIGKSDLIFAMEPAHIDIIKQLDPTASIRTYLLKEFSRSPEDSTYDPFVDDPISGSEEVYRRVYSELDDEIDRIIPHLKKVIERAR